MLTNTFILLANWIEMSKIILSVSSGMGGRCVCPSWRLQLPWSAQSSRPSESMYHKNGLSDGTSLNSFTSEVRTCQCTVSKYLSCVESMCVCVFVSVEGQQQLRFSGCPLCRVRQELWRGCLWRDEGDAWRVCREYQVFTGEQVDFKSIPGPIKDVGSMNYQC